MPEKLPVPLVPVAFADDAAPVECLRSALNTAKRMQVGVVFECIGVTYTVHPWMSVDQVVSLADAALGTSVREHLSHG